MDLFSKEQKISLQFPKDDKLVEMSCTIDNVYNDRLDVILPQYFMRYIQYLQVGARLLAKVFTKLGTIDFSTIVISSPLEDTFTVELDYNSIKLSPDKEQATVESVESIEIHCSSGAKSGKTVAISASGIKFQTNEVLTVGDNYDFKLFLPREYGTINFKATITEVDEVYDNEYTATFFTITEVCKQILLYYMYIYDKDLNG